MNRNRFFIAAIFIALFAGFFFTGCGKEEVAMRTVTIINIPEKYNGKAIVFTSVDFINCKATVDLNNGKKMY